MNKEQRKLLIDAELQKYIEVLDNNIESQQDLKYLDETILLEEYKVTNKIHRLRILDLLTNHTNKREDIVVAEVVIEPTNNPNDQNYL